MELPKEIIDGIIKIIEKGGTAEVRIRKSDIIVAESKFEVLRSVPRGEK